MMPMLLMLGIHGPLTKATENWLVMATKESTMPLSNQLDHQIVPTIRIDLVSMKVPEN